MHHHTLSARRNANAVDNFSTSIIVVGSGRVGERIASLALADRAFEVRAVVARDGSPRLGEALHASDPSAMHDTTDRRATIIGSAKTAANTGVCDVVVDFSSDSGAAASLALARSLGSALLVGTTALSERSLDALRGTAIERAVLVAPNTSLGVATLSVLVARASALLGSEYHCSIVEAHHAMKKDAPSGTALRLADAARRDGREVRRDDILSMRGGDVIGEHTVRFAGPGEYLELTHRATTRDLFAVGALRAARWLRGRAPGWYSMHDVLDMPA